MTTPINAAEDGNDPGTRVPRPIAGGKARRSIVAAWHAGRHRNGLAERFLEMLRMKGRRRTACRRE